MISFNFSEQPKKINLYEQNSNPPTDDERSKRRHVTLKPSISVVALGKRQIVFSYKKICKNITNYKPIHQPFTLNED